MGGRSKGPQRNFFFLKKFMPERHKRHALKGDLPSSRLSKPHFVYISNALLWYRDDNVNYPKKYKYLHTFRFYIKSDLFTKQALCWSHLKPMFMLTDWLREKISSTLMRAVVTRGKKGVTCDWGDASGIRTWLVTGNRVSVVRWWRCDC